MSKTCTRKIGVPFWVITATQGAAPPGWSDETFTEYRAFMRRMQDEIVSRSPQGRRIEAPTSHTVQLDAPEFVAGQIRAIAHYRP